MVKNICLLWHCCYPWDIRIEKICKTLVSANYKVDLICRGKKGQKIEGNELEISIHRVMPPEYMNTDILTFPLFLNPIWITSVRKIFSHNKYQLIIVRDIHMAYLAGKLAKQMEVPVILDMAENYPAALLVYNNKKYKPFLFKNAWIAREYEKKCLKYMTHIFVVCKEQQERLIGLGINQEKISIVRNTPDLEFYWTTNKSSEALLDENKRITLTYVGYIDAHRGVETLVRGVALAAKTATSIFLRLIGAGGKADDELLRLKKLAEELGIKKHIEFTGWLPFEKVLSFIQNSDIGVIPHFKSEHTDTTIPNKLFDYMAFSKPVITSDLDPVVNIVRKEKCGLVFKSGDPQDLAKKIIELINSGNISKFGERGLRAVNGMYNWNIDQQVIINSINSLLK